MGQLPTTGEMGQLPICHYMTTFIYPYDYVYLPICGARMIVENERDRRTATWLIETYGAEAVAEAETRIAGARKPYPGNIAKVLGATLPEAIKRTENAAARQKLAELRRMLEGKGG